MHLLLRLTSQLSIILLPNKNKTFDATHTTTTFKGDSLSEMDGWSTAAFLQPNAAVPSVSELHQVDEQQVYKGAFATNEKVKRVENQTSFLTILSNKRTSFVDVTYA